MVDDSTRKTLSSIPLLKTKAGPRDKELWPQRLKEEYQSLIQVSLHFIYLLIFENTFNK
jgi:ufm1-conjugating enzyme 1